MIVPPDEQIAREPSEQGGFCVGEKKVGERDMTEKQKRFCEEYLVDLNETQAAVRAGYSEKTAYSIGSEDGVEISGKEKIKALELLGKHLGIFTEHGSLDELPDNGLMDALDQKASEVFTNED